MKAHVCSDGYIRKFARVFCTVCGEMGIDIEMRDAEIDRLNMQWALAGEDEHDDSGR